MAGQSAHAESSRSAAGGRNPWLIALIVSMATFMEVLDTSIANVALKHIAGGVSASQDESTWVLTSYLVSNAIILPLSGWLSLVIGRKRFYMGCVALFGISSLLCGLSSSLGMLIFFRVMQGLGGGGLGPSEQSILADSFPPEKHGQAFALYGVAIVVAPAIGPALGGWITDNYSWHWLFLINVPVCLLSLTLTALFLVEAEPLKQERKRAVAGGFAKVDYLGAALVAAGLGCLQVVLDKGQEDDWFHSDLIIVFSLISILSLFFLVIWEMNHENPIVDIPLMADRGFGSSSAAMFGFGFVLLGTTQAIPQLLQTLFNYDATTAGLALMGGGFATMLVMPIVGNLLRVVQPKYLVAVGFTIEAFACWHLSGINTDISFGHAAWARVAQTVGLPFLFVPITTSSYIGLPPEKRGNASAIINAMRNLGGSFGISTATTLLARRGQFHHARLVESLSPLNPSYQAEHRLHPSLALFEATAQKQAGMLSYLDIFWLFSIISCIAVAIALCMRSRSGSETGPAH